MIQGIGVGGTRVPQASEVADHLLLWAKVHHLSLGQQPHLIKHREELGARLVDGHDNHLLPAVRQIGERADEMARREAVQPSGRLVQQQQLCSQRAQCEWERYSYGGGGGAFCFAYVAISSQ
jgi:hypothetical protein